MKPAPFAYARPGTVDEALDLLAVPGALALAGGQSLVGLLNLRRVRPATVVDLGALVELRGIALDGDELTVGATTTLAELERDARAIAAAPLLVEAAGLVGNPQVRARGTIGGTLAHGDPVAEMPVALAALGARAIVRGAAERVVALDRRDGPITRPGELIVAVRIPAARPGSGVAFEEIALRRGSRAFVSAAAVVRAERVRVAIGGLTAAPLVVSVDVHGDASAAEARIAAAIAGAAIAPPDPRVPDAYRRDVAVALARRTARAGARRAAGPAAATPPASASSPPRAPAAASSRAPVAADAEVEIELSVNGRAERVRVAPRALLSDVLRHDIGLTATHVGCEHGVCGACNVLLDGRAIRSCLTLAVQAEGATIRTVEGLRDDGDLDAVARAFAEHHALQCGFCTPGFLVTVAERRAAGERLDAAALAGNVCRCTGYAPIVQALEALA